MLPKYPVYIISKGRWDTRLTSKALEYMNIPYCIVVEPQEHEAYSKVIAIDKVLILPPKYQQEYDTFDEVGDSKSKGPGAARNFCWEHSISRGFSRHWVLDDNISGFVRLNHNRKIPVQSASIFRASEDFVDRYENVAIAGFNYRFFGGGQRRPCAPFLLNRRIYSCLLIKNDIPYRWRGRYNEDTDLCLRVLKDGWCTIEFNAFLQNKARTQTVKGGNSKEFYDKEGTYPKSKIIEDMHPDVAKVVWRYGRWHHQVDYDLFNKNKLIKKEGACIPEGINDYGMKLIEVNNEEPLE